MEKSKLKGVGAVAWLAHPHQLVRQQVGYPGKCGGRLESLSHPDLQQLSPWWPCSWDSRVHTELCLPRAVCLVLRSTVSGRRNKTAPPGMIAFIKTVQIIKIVGFCFYFCFGSVAKFQTEAVLKLSYLFLSCQNEKYKMAMTSYLQNLYWYKCM